MELQGINYLGISSFFSDEELMVQHTTREFVENEISPIIDDHYKLGTFPIELVLQFGDMQYLGVNLPEEYGGSGMSNVTYGLICQELERGDSGIRSFVSVQSSLVMYPIFSYGSEDQKRKWLPLLASGEVIGCFGLTEPDHGSDPAGMTTRAKKVSGGYILNGAKMWITNGSIADVSVVWAKTEDKVVRGFLVEKGADGFTAPDMKNKWSLRASVTSELILQDVFVPNENILPEIEGMKGPLSCLTQARYGIGWGAIGCAMAVYEASVKYAKERTQFDKPIGSFQLVQEKLVWMLTEITKGQLLALHTGKNKDNGTLTFQQVSMAKRNNTWVARECAKLAREIHGANGITGEYPIMRHLMNMESVYTYEGTYDMHTLILGQDITGKPAFR
ncbi:MAG: acyl-CoA dehydrogenase family protein [Candidatus Marinimicrobia bacterium]|jgi:glutaryl-CoA dehydrogenase|nr:acyl-CoA dehydrogenase family protein [Candidatus Neomarinimicrobiota bacterium]MDP6275392.1 acyl-CoA dehydrogenase family protein [Candidatus Neomarinimicrobiota bacterium]MDP6499885.1 acyl-CoA dehydrogenase family protein [Candidatus Neomarinimicrobiota bacterium]MDP7330417.1 acyl-CoA dehydrogenase family protein [Candidatus Neomarinimicrobiota bacterium]MDP7566152.1 acyl-CoA dehydrogenase family protein [Candidatus Neomarinimicrobiota bacterium]|tara:strand:- start:454 stop:1623 length:1170 start_codon:yes stop_codon:yes gene_type:complete